MKISVILIWIWQFPQHLVALILRKTFDIEYTEKYEWCKVYRVKQKYVGASLGRYIFLSTYFRIQTVKHEFGHSVQSLYLGPLYLLVIGLPSFFLCYLRDRVFHSDWDMPKRVEWYYKQPTEKSADRLGGIDRSLFDGE